MYYFIMHILHDNILAINLNISRIYHIYHIVAIIILFINFLQLPRTGYCTGLRLQRKKSVICLSYINWFQEKFRGHKQCDLRRF